MLVVLKGKKFKRIFNIHGQFILYLARDKSLNCVPDCNDPHLVTKYSVNKICSFNNQIITTPTVQCQAPLSKRLLVKVFYFYYHF